MQEGGTEASDDSTGGKAGGQEDKNCAARYTGLCTAWHGGGSKNACQTDVWDVGWRGSESSSRREGSWECQYPKHSPGV